MNDAKNFRSGFVALIGRPNVGKSTLVNALVKTKISIVSSIPQTTRHLVRGIVTSDDAQIVFIDSPGIHSFKEELAKQLNAVAKKSIIDIELILYVIDVSRPPGLEEERITDFLLRQKDAKVIIAFNKMDKSKAYLNEYVSFWKAAVQEKQSDPLIACVPISAKTEKNLDILLRVIKENLPSQPPFYEKETVTDFPLTYKVADIIREKIFEKAKKELPHEIAVEVKGIEEKENIVYIPATIYVNRDSQKKIIVGKKGSFLADIGKQSRLEIEKLFPKRVFLELWVKVLPDWQKKLRVLKDLGYEEG